MYTFINTNEASESVLLPSEALKINGSYIENLIPGYRTLHVSGREALSPELSSFETGIRDGSTVKGKRYPARTITVTYQLIAESNEAFREAYNTLAGILNVDDAELIFDDEPDKFYIGTPMEFSNVEPGRNSVIGDIKIFCADPFKYSVLEYEVSPLPDENIFLIDYHGTYKAYPKLQAHFYKETEIDNNTVHTLSGNGDCGYVAFFDEGKRIIQIGDPDEADGENIAPKSQTLIHQEFMSQNAWGSAGQSLWKRNSGSVFPENTVQVGSAGMTAGAYASDGSASYYYLSATDYGTNQGVWHGPSITRSIPADASGYAGASNFLVSYKHKICIGGSENSVNQYGDFQVQISDANGKIIAGVRVCKWKSGKTGEAMFYVNGSKIKAVVIDLSHWNALTGRDEASIPTSWIRKTGSEIVFNLIGMRYVFTDTTLKNTVAKNITVMFGTYSDKPAISYNGLYWLKFVKDNCNTYVDVPNKFSANDVLEADCRQSEIYLNGVCSPELGALGNDWEYFFLKPGLNRIGVAFSDWVKEGYEPTFKIRYREVFL